MSDLCPTCGAPAEYLMNGKPRSEFRGHLNLAKVTYRFDRSAVLQEFIEGLMPGGSTHTFKWSQADLRVAAGL